MSHLSASKLDGCAYAMDSPGTLHQDMVLALALRLSPQLQGGPCRLFLAPLDVKRSEYDLVQPDLLVVCQKEQIKSGYVEGPPKLVIEVLSPSTQRHDRIRKLDLYGKFGVAECWLVTPSPFMWRDLRQSERGLCAIGGSQRKRLTAQPDLPQSEAGPGRIVCQPANDSFA